MKTRYFIILLLTFALFLPNAPSQDYTKWNLLKGVQARLGNGMGYAPN